MKVRKVKQVRGVLSFEDVKKPSIGAIHKVVMPVKTVDDEHNVIKHSVAVYLSRQTATGIENQFATIHMHLCGIPIVSTTPWAGLSIDTIEREVLPAMKAFAKAYSDDASDAERLARIEAALGVVDGVSCSAGGCKSCAPIRARLAELVGARNGQELSGIADGGQSEKPKHGDKKGKKGKGR